VHGITLLGLWGVGILGHALLIRIPTTGTMRFRDRRLRYRRPSEQERIKASRGRPMEGKAGMEFWLWTGVSRVALGVMATVRAGSVVVLSLEEQFV
jgi:hypothetical protein